MKAFKIGTVLNKKGLIQSLNRRVSWNNFPRRLNVYVPKIKVMIGQRKSRPSQYGIICH